MERKKRWHGQTLRGENLVKEVIEWLMQGKTGKLRITLMDDIKTDET